MNTYIDIHVRDPHDGYTYALSPANVFGRVRRRVEEWQWKLFCLYFYDPEYCCPPLPSLNGRGDNLFLPVFLSVSPCLYVHGNGVSPSAYTYVDVRVCTSGVSFVVVEILFRCRAGRWEEKWETTLVRPACLYAPQVPLPNACIIELSLQMAEHITRTFQLYGKVARILRYTCYAFTICTYCRDVCDGLLLRKINLKVECCCLYSYYWYYTTYTLTTWTTYQSTSHNAPSNALVLD